MSQYTPAQTALTEELRRIAGIEDVARALGIQDITSQDEEFWSGQRRAATSRFYLMLLSARHLDLALRREELDDETASMLQATAKSLVDKASTDYVRIRQWFLNYGQYVYNSALARRKEREHVASMSLRLLVVLEKGVGYLAYDRTGTPVLVQSVDEAYQFDVQHASELQTAHLQEMSKHFSAIRTLFNAKDVKLLAGKRTA